MGTYIHPVESTPKFMDTYRIVGVEIYHIYKYSDTNLRFYLIL